MLELDHLPFSVVDVDATRALFERLGFAPTPVGVCRWTRDGRADAARAASVVFERAYLDFIEARDPDWERRLRASPVHQQGLAPSGIVLGSPRFDAARTALAARGVALGDGYEIVRELAGATPPAMRYAFFGLKDAIPFSVIQDFAPRAMRREPWLRHANGVRGVRAVHLRVASLDAWSAAAAVLFDRSAAEIPLGGAATLVAHAEPRDPYLQELSVLLTRRERPTLLAIEFATDTLDALPGILERGGLPWREREGGIALAPDTGYGCGIVFTPRGPM